MGSEKSRSGFQVEARSDAPRSLQNTFQNQMVNWEPWLLCPVGHQGDETHEKRLSLLFPWQNGSFSKAKKGLAFSRTSQRQWGWLPDLQRETNEWRSLKKYRTRDAMEPVGVSKDWLKNGWQLHPESSCPVRAPRVRHLFCQLRTIGQATDEKKSPSPVKSFVPRDILQIFVIRSDDEWLLCLFQPVPPLFQHQLHGQRLLVPHMIVALRRTRFMGGRCYPQARAGRRPLILTSTINKLQATHPQDRWGGKPGLESPERCLKLSGPRELGLCMWMWWSNSLAEIPDEMVVLKCGGSIAAAYNQKVLVNSIVFTFSGPLLRDDKPQERHSGPAETLFKLPVLEQFLQQSDPHVLSRSRGKKDVFKVHKQEDFCVLISFQICYRIRKMVGALVRPLWGGHMR